jgi:small subunit ribosomal protein S1
MSEGTKLGEYKDHQEFNSAIVREGVHQDSSATKIGELSEFEKSLFDSEPEGVVPVPVVEEPKASVVPQVVEEAVDEESEFLAGLDDVKSSSDLTDSFADQLDRLADYQEGDIIKGIVRRIEKSGVMVDINFKSDGFIANSEFSNDSSEVIADIVKPGDEVSVFIVKLESKEGYTVLSKKRADYEVAWGRIIQLAKSRDTIQVKVNSKVQGGVVADFFGIKGFIPASQLVLESDGDLQSFVNQVLEVSVLQADRRRRKVIFSQKQALAKSQRADHPEIIDQLEVGQVRPGKVTSIKDFGVFVDLGGVEGLVHISELSWSRVSHPSDLVKVGQDVNVFILGVDRDTKKISLGMKQLEADPWVSVAQNYHIGDLVEGTITRVVPFGAFIRINDHLEGLIHISELSLSHVNKVEDVVHSGQVVKAKVIKLVPSEQRIGLSIKSMLKDEQAPAASGEAPAQDESAAS